MRTTFLAALAAVLSLGALAGCGHLPQLSMDDLPPTSVVGVRPQGLSAEGVDLVFDVQIENPYQVPLPLLGFDYRLTSGGRGFLSGRSDEQAMIPSGGRKTIPLATSLTFADALDIASSVRPGGKLPYEAEIDVALDAPVLGRVSVPVRHRDELPIPALPRVAVQGVQWNGAPGLGGASGVLALGIENPNSFPLGLQNLDLGLDLAGVRIGGIQPTAPSSLSAGQTGQVQIPFSLSAAQVLQAGLGALMGNNLAVGLDGGLTVSTPLGPLNVPLRQSTRATRL